MAWDISVSKTGLSATYVYDGNGNRVKETETISSTTTTTVMVGNRFEKNVTSGVSLSYYYAGAQRVALRTSAGVVQYLLTDQLGSSSVALDSTGAVTSTLRYKPFGETRSGSMPTDYHFTGQREEANVGLYDYGARFYKPVTGRFIQPDTLVPDPANPQSLNRYSYVLNRPLNYTDPT